MEGDIQARGGVCLEPDCNIVLERVMVTGKAQEDPYCIQAEASQADEIPSRALCVNCRGPPAAPDCVVLPADTSKQWEVNMVHIIANLLLAF